jgi:hypothetical protein
MIDLHSIVASFYKTKCAKLTVMHEINHVLGEDIIGYSTVGKYVWMFGCLDVWMFVSSMKETNTPIAAESDGVFSLDNRIALLLSGDSSLSVHQIVKKAMMSKSTVYRHLTQTMRWSFRHLKRVSHSLTESERMNRVQRSTKLLRLLQSIRHQGWQYIVTFDES